jgi:hypothetical protein
LGFARCGRRWAKAQWRSTQPTARGDRTEETLWLRILGRDGTQEQAIREVLALPSSHPRRNSILRLLASWKVRISLGDIQDFSGQEAMMALSEAFLAWEQQKETQTKEAIALKMLRDNLPLEQISRLTDLTIAQLQQLQSEQQ